MKWMPDLRIARTLAMAVAMLCAGVLLWAGGEDAEKTFSVTTRATAGAAVRIPVADRATVMLFVRPEQLQSTRMIESVKRILADKPAAQVLAVLSGDRPDDQVQAYAKTLPCPLVLDPDFTIVGQLRIRVWPTTVVIQSDGSELGRMAGLPPSYVGDLAAYLDFTAKKIDRQTLEQRLAADDVVADAPRQRARRHLQVALRMLERDDLDAASRELDQGLKHQSNDSMLLLTKARVLLLLQKPEEALAVLGRLDQNTALAPSIEVLRGGALVAREQWDQAIPALLRAVKLNPNPSEGYYFLGMAYRHKGQWREAAAAFRKAFESGPDGRLISRSLQPLPTGPESQPSSQPATRPAAG